MLAVVMLLVVGAEGSALADLVPGLLALGGIAATGGFLIWDLKRPDRFHYLFFRPQWRSWLAIGTQVINVAALLALAFTVAAAGRRRRRARRPALGDGARRRRAGRLHGVPVRPVRGPRPVAEPAAAAAHDRQRAAGRRRLARHRRARASTLRTRRCAVLGFTLAVAAALSLAIAVRGRVGGPSDAAGRARGEEPPARPLRPAVLRRAGARLRAARAAGRGLPRRGRHGTARARGRLGAGRAVALRGRLGPRRPERAAELGGDHVAARRSAQGPRAGARAGLLASPRALGRLARVRPRGVAAQGRALLHAGADGLLQLRGGVRAARLRRPRDARGPQARGQPDAPGQPRAQLRQGPGDDQPDPRSRADPAIRCGASPARRAAGASGSG